MSAPLLLVLGHAAHDLVYRVDAIPSRPVKVVARALSECGGGMAANAGVAIARLGGRVDFYGRVADDELGARIAADLQREGIDVSGLRRLPGCRSPVSSVLVDDRGDRLICSYTDPGLDPDPSWLPLHRVPDYDVVLADVRWPQGAEVVLEAARRTGRPGLLDADVALPGVLERLLGCATHVLFSEAGLDAAQPGVPPGSALRNLARPGHRIVGVTLGRDGFLWREEGRERRVAAPRIEAVDTLAAGDVWHGAFALALAEGRHSEDAAGFANRAAALKCLKPGGRAGAPTRAELDAWTVE